jgi:hypothetical protein
MSVIKPITSMNIETVPVTVQGFTVEEPTIESMKKVLDDAKILQRSLVDAGYTRRLEMLVSLGELWVKNNSSGLWDEVKETLAKSTGYSRSMIDEEFSLVAQVFNRENLSSTLINSLTGGVDSLERFSDLGIGEGIRSMPIGPIMIVSSGNSLIPPLIPTVIGLLTGNFVILKPSLTNVLGLNLIFSLLNEVEDSEVLRDCLLVVYLSHTSEVYDYLLSEAPLGIVNFWGAQPAIGIIGTKVGENPHHPRYLVNGPLTGFTVIKEKKADDETASGLAFNIILYDQQLCNSPTQGAFIGSSEACMVFMEKVAAHLDRLGETHPIAVSEALTYMLQGVRRLLIGKGSKVLSGRHSDNPWTLVVSDGYSRLGEAVEVFPQFNLYNRRRFIEIIRVDRLKDALQLIRYLPENKAWSGVERVQTVGAVELDEEEYKMLAETGVYRIVPLRDMYLRSPCEPYDGVSLADAFTYRVYRRK